MLVAPRRWAQGTPIRSRVGRPQGMRGMLVAPRWWGLRELGHPHLEPCRWAVGDAGHACGAAQVGSERFRACSYFES